MNTTKSIIPDLYIKMQFDEKEVDTKLAEEYMKKNNNTFSPFTKRSFKQCDPVYDNQGNKIFICDKFSTNSEVVPKIDVKLLRNISIEIEKNSDLFAQLEYKIRKIPERDVKNFDIKLITQQFARIQLVTFTPPEYEVKPMAITMYENQPLCTLGLVAEVLATHKVVNIVASKNTAVITILFAELCVKAGLETDNINVFLVGKEIEWKYYITSSTGLQFYPDSIVSSGSLAVVTEIADLDSVANTVLRVTSNNMYPWRIQLVLVQENIDDKFKKAITAKIDLNNSKVVTSKDEIKQLITERVLIYDTKDCSGENSKLSQEIISRLPIGLDKYICNNTEVAVKEINKILTKATDVYVCEEKIFLFDYAGSIEEIPNSLPVVLIETYRTTKELLCLIKKYRPSYLSLWCNDVSVSNEIIYGSNVANVWLNDYGVFEGVGDVAETFYKGYECTPLDFQANENDMKDFAEQVGNLSKMWSVWVKYNLNKRKTIISNVFEKYKETASTENEWYINIRNLVENLQIWNKNITYSIENGKLCQRINEHIGKIVHINDRGYNEMNIIAILKSILNGNGIILRGYCEDECIKLLNLFASEGVPILTDVTSTWSLDYFSLASTFKELSLVTWRFVFDEQILYRPRTIWSSFGETFAN